MTLLTPPPLGGSQSNKVLLVPLEEIYNDTLVVLKEHLYHKEP